MVTIQKDTLLEPLKWLEPSVRFTNMLQEKLMMMRQNQIAIYKLLKATKWVPTPMERPARVVPIDQFCEGLSEQMEINEINTVRGLPKAKILELVKLVLMAIQRGRKYRRIQTD